MNTKGMIDIKRAVSSNNVVQFDCYQSGNLFYKTAYNEIFMVPISDTGDGIFKDRDKAIYFMRYMRKWNESLK
jgi:hypothetical protein